MDQKEEKDERRDSSKEVIVEGKSDKDVAQIDQVIGDFGKYQFLIYLFKILIGVTSAFNNLGVTFFAPTKFIGHSCADLVPAGYPPLGLNASYPQTLGTSGAIYLHSKPAFEYSSLFAGLFDNELREHKHSTIKSYENPTSLRRECSFKSPQDNLERKCTSYNYDTGIWISTIIDEWDLVCSRAWLVSLTQSLYMSGFILSYIMFGYLSDRFGRWKSLLIGATVEILAGFGCSLSTSIYMFLMFRFLLGFGNAGRSSSSYLIMIEWVGPKWRMLVSTMGALGWVIGYCAMPWITMHFLHFRHMQLFVCFYEMVMMIWLLRLPESPRWLLTHKQFDKAYKVLLMAAKFNGLIKPESATEVTTNTDKLQTVLTSKLVFTADEPAKESGLKPYTLREFDIKFKNLVKGIETKEFSKNEDNLSILDLFKWPNLRRYALTLFFIWASNSFIYYGIVLNVGDFGGKNLFLAFTISGLTELPSIAFTIICMELLPRRTTNVFISSIVGLLCAILIPLRYYDYRGLQQVTMMFAKLFNSCAFTVVLYQTMELFPTSIRQTAYSSCSLAGRVGSILAPFIKLLIHATNENVAPALYIVLSIVTGLLASQLPETKGSDLSDTLLEAEKFKGLDERPKRSKRESA